MEISNQPLAACTETEAIGEGAGAGTLGSTPARWLVEFTADTMRVSVSYKYGSRSFSGASWATVSISNPGLLIPRKIAVSTWRQSAFWARTLKRIHEKMVARGNLDETRMDLLSVRVPRRSGS